METDRTWAQIDLNAAKHNYQEIMRVSGKPVIAVIKADAYGHGAVELARLYESMHAPLFAVACMNEAIELREAGITTPILILGVTSEQDMCKLSQYQLLQAVPSVSYAHRLYQYAPDVSVHIKIETGMGRLGVREAHEVCKIAHLFHAEGIFTHFSSADETDLTYTEQQMEKFLNIIQECRVCGVSFRYCHCANSAAVLHYKKACSLDLVRPGLLLYGLYTDSRHENMQLEPVMSLYTRVCDVRDIHQGENISYGRTFTAERDMRVAVLPIGYADGLRRSLSNSYEVFLCGIHVPIIGRICMDMCMVDVTDVPNAKIGDIAEVFGQQISVDEMADKLDTISYEILTGIAKRVPRVYLPVQEG